MGPFVPKSVPFSNELGYFIETGQIIHKRLPSAPSDPGKIYGYCTFEDVP